jgi:hypothetical protein
MRRKSEIRISKSETPMFQTRHSPCDRFEISVIRSLGFVSPALSGVEGCFVLRASSFQAAYRS